MPNQPDADEFPEPVHAGDVPEELCAEIEMRETALMHAARVLFEQLSYEQRELLPFLSASFVRSSADPTNRSEWTVMDMRNYASRYANFPLLVVDKQNAFLLDQLNAVGSIPLTELAALVELNAKVDRWLFAGLGDEAKFEEQDLGYLTTGDVLEWSTGTVLVRRDVLDAEGRLDPPALRIDRRYFLVLAKLVGVDLAQRKTQRAEELKRYETWRGPSKRRATPAYDLLADALESVARIIRRRAESGDALRHDDPELELLVKIIRADPVVMTRLIQEEHLASIPDGPPQSEEFLTIGAINLIAKIFRQQSETVDVLEAQRPELAILLQLMFQEAGILSRLVEGRVVYRESDHPRPALWIEVFAGRNPTTVLTDYEEETMAIESLDVAEDKRTVFDDPNNIVYLIDPAAMLLDANGQFRTSLLLDDATFARMPEADHGFDLSFTPDENLLNEGRMSTAIPHMRYEKMSRRTNRFYRKRIQGIVDVAKDLRSANADFDETNPHLLREAQRRARRSREQSAERDAKREKS